MRERGPISASAIGLAACLSLLALPPATVRATTVDASTAMRLADARRGVSELLESLRDAVQRERVRPAAMRPARRPVLADALHTAPLPLPAFRLAPPALPASLSRMVNLPPPAAA